MSLSVNTFISHSWAYSGHYETLAGWLFHSEWSVDGAPLVFLDNSVPKDDPIHDAPNQEVLRKQIYDLISRSDVVVIPAGMYVNYSKWIQKEIDGAVAYRKPILGVNPWGQERKSSIVQSVATETVGWNKQSVASAIWRLYRT